MLKPTWTTLGAGYLAACVLSWLWTRARAPGFRVAGRHMLITGGSSGLGLALAKIYLHAGAKVTILARDPVKLDDAKRQLECSFCSERERCPVFARECDVTDYQAMQQAVAAANAFHGRVTDHVICNAGDSTPGLLLDQDVDSYRHTMDVNYFGGLHTVKATLPAMVETPLPAGEPKRRVVFISSAAGLLTFIGFSQYSSTKFAVRGLAESLRNELLLYEIEVSVFYPGMIETPMLAADDAVRPAATNLVMSGSIRRTAEQAATSLVAGLACGEFAITNEFLLWGLRLLSNGVTPRSNRPLELLLFPIAIVLEYGYLTFMDWVVKRRAAKQVK